MSELDWTIVVGVIMVLGWAGTLIPVLPGLILMWFGGLVYGLGTGFGATGWTVMALLTALVATSVIKSFIVPKQAASAYGASSLSQFGALAGAIVGFFAIPIVGLFVGAVAGIFIVEQVASRDLAQAWRSTKGVTIGMIKNAALDIAIGLVMFLAWVSWAATTL